MATLDLALLQSQPGEFFRKLKETASHFYDAKQHDEYDPALHDVHNTTLRPDRYTQYEEPKNPSDPDNTEMVTRTRKVLVNRIAFNIQKLIVKRSAALLTGGGVDLKPYGDGGAGGEKLLEALKLRWIENKLRFKNGEIARAMMSQKEVAELWYFGQDGTPRIKIHKPADGFTFYPIWDGEGSMAAFGIGWEVEGEDYSEAIRIWTPEKVLLYQLHGGTWLEAENKINDLGKIPISYYYQPEVEWADVQDAISRIEKLISNVADINDYTASPLLAVYGEVAGFFRKGDTGSMVQMQNGTNGETARAEYIASPNAPDTLKLEIDTLFKMIWTGSQTPDFSLEAMRGLGDVSGEALKRVFIDAYLKATEKQQSAYGEGIQRRINILLAMEAKLQRTEVPKGFGIEPVFIPFSMEGDTERIENAMKSAGGVAVRSQREAIAASGVTDDPDAMLAEIREEQKISGNIQNVKADDQPTI